MHREEKGLSQGHWKSWDLNPGSLDPVYILLNERL